MGSKTAAVVACLTALLAGASAVHGADVNVIASTAMREVLEELVPMFERASGHKVTLSFQSGAVLPVKVKEGAQADLVVTTPETIDDLVKAGKVEAGTRVDFVRSGAGVAVRAGAGKPDIGTPEAFKSALLAAKTVGYSQGPSGVHFMTVLARPASPTRSRPRASFPRSVSGWERWSPRVRPKSACSRSPSCC